MRTFFPLLLLVVYVCSEEPHIERLYETVKGVLVKGVMDYEDGRPSKVFYKINVPAVGNIPEKSVTLLVNNPRFITLLPGTEVRAPVRQVDENVYELIDMLRPLKSDGAQNVGRGGVNGGGIEEARLRNHDFIRRIHAGFDQAGARSHKMEPLVSGERSLVVVGINFKSKPMKADMQTITDWMFDGTDNVDKLYNECTRGQLRFPKQKAVILGPFTIQDPVKKGSSEWLDEVQAKSVAAIKENNANVDVTKFDHLVMILPDFGPEDQGASGLAPVGPDCGKPCPVWINTDIMQRPVTAIGHELGHNLGWSHAGVLPEGGFNIPKPRSNVEASYGDMTGLMGNGPQVCPNFPHQMTQKWVTNTQMLGKSADNVALAPLGTPTPNALQGIILLTNPISTYISYRALVGPDVRLEAVDKAGKGTWSNSVFVYLDNDGRKTTNIARISVGQTFNDKSGLYSITFTSVNNGVAYLNIKVTDKEDCAGNPCGANGQCIEQIGAYVCQCNKGWMGPQCTEPVCYKYKVDGFGTLSMLNGEWERADDYAGRLSYKISGYVLFFAPPNKWVIGQRPAGGSGYFVYAESNADSPGFISSPWMSSNTRYSPTFTCTSKTAPEPVPVCSQIKGEGFLPENNLNAIFDRRADVNGFAAYTNSQSKISVFWSGNLWMASTDVKATQATFVKTDEDPVAPHAVKKWTETMSAIGGKWIVSKGKFTGLGCSSSGGNQKPVDCQGQWSEWTACSAQCGGTQTRNFKITLPSSNGGAICNTVDGQVEQRSCGSPCVNPVNCVGSWSNWGVCSATCGTGKSTRVYTVTTTAVHGGMPCPTREGQTETQVCNTNPCPSVNPTPAPGPASIDCRGTWSSWGACSVTCGSGKQTRSYTITQFPQNGGKPCETTNGRIEELACNTQPCGGSSGAAVDCQGAFSTWGSCSKTCGGGISSRTYYVLKAPTPSGKPCEFSAGLQQTTSCNTQACGASSGGVKVDCRGGFTAWGECSKACGEGVQTRTFYVIDQPQNGGAPCAKGDRTVETQPCKGNKCQTESISGNSNHFTTQLASPASLVAGVGIVLVALVIAVVIVRRSGNNNSQVAQSYSLL